MRTLAPAFTSWRFCPVAIFGLLLCPDRVDPQCVGGLYTTFAWHPCCLNSPWTDRETVVPGGDCIALLRCEPRGGAGLIARMRRSTETESSFLRYHAVSYTHLTLPTNREVYIS